jgi:hypothetical protein
MHFRDWLTGHRTGSPYDMHQRELKNTITTAHIRADTKRLGPLASDVCRGGKMSTLATQDPTFSASASPHPSFLTVDDAAVVQVRKSSNGWRV